jgi:hypothetical protein
MNKGPRWISWLLAGMFLCTPLLAQPSKGIGFFLVEEIFPHIAVGGVWSTELTFINLGNETAAFPLRFFKPDGKPWVVSILGAGPARSSFALSLQPGISLVLALPSNGSDIATGWAEIEQPSNTSIGGHAIFTDRTSGRPVFEAVVPLSDWGDNDFFMPFDNTNGSVTCVAFANPSASTDTSLSVEFKDNGGARLLATTRSLTRMHQQSFCLPAEFPATSGKRGSLRVVGSASQLSALGFRFTPGGAFTTFFAMSGL